MIVLIPGWADVCPTTGYPHLFIRFYKRPWRRLWRKQQWVGCPDCDGEWLYGLG